jgi:enoyl-CoA hydratase
VALVRLERPRVLNAIDGATCAALADAIASLDADDGAGAIVVCGAGDRAFSAGADLKFMRALDGAALRRFIEQTWVVFDRLATSRLPSVAALHGYVLGGGLELALACDLRVAEEGVEIGLPEMGLGSVPGSGALQRLPALVGPARAAEMVLLGRRIGASEAAATGLVNRAVARGEALASAIAWAETIAALPPEAVRYAKVALRMGCASDVAPSLHGLVSQACHAEKGYRDNVGAFSHGQGGRAGGAQ